MQQHALLATKLYIPPIRPELVSRPRLIERLNAGLGQSPPTFGRRLTLVSAPAGFGKWDWVANGLIFTLYHVHQPWGFLSTWIEDIFLLALPAKRFQSTWMSIIIHGAQNVFFLFLVLGLVLGLA